MYLQNHHVSGNRTPLEARHTNWAIEMRTQGFVPALFGYTYRRSIRVNTRPPIPRIDAGMAFFQAWSQSFN